MPMMKYFLSVVGFGLLLLGLLGFSGRPSAEFDFSKHRVPLDQILSGGPPKDEIPAILTPVFVTTEDDGFLHDHDRILGSVEGGEAKAYPATLVLSTKTGFSRDYRRDPYVGYAQRAALMFPTVKTDSRFHPKEWVLGLTVGGIAKAYPFSELKKANGPLHDKVNEQRVTIQFNAEAQSASAMDATGKPLPTVMAFWFAWYAFHPETEVFWAP